MADIVTIDFDPISGVSLTDLEAKLQLYKTRKLKIGTFSAASNVTGTLTDVDAVSILMHRAGGLVFFDYATAAPYVKVRLLFFTSCRQDSVSIDGHESLACRCVSGLQRCYLLFWA